MSRLSELIADLCPDGVEYKALGELGAFYGGLTGKTKKDFGSGAHFVSYNNVYNNPSVDLTTEDYVEVGPNERQNAVHKGDVLFTISSENREEAGLTSVMTREPDDLWYLNSFCTGWRAYDPEKFLPDYLKHLLRGSDARKAISRTANGVTRFNISKPKLARVRIPVPPIEVQREVVRILDEYSEVHDELVKQLGDALELNKCLCDGIMDSVFSDLPDVVWSTLGGVCKKAVSGGTPSKTHPEYFGEGYPWLRTQEVDFCDVWSTGMSITKAGLDNSSAQVIPVDCLIVAMYGATAAKVAVNKIEMTTNQACCNLSFDSDIMLTQYAFYWMMHNYEKLKSMGRGSQNNISAGIIKKYPIPVIPVDEQARIVKLLERSMNACKAITACKREKLSLFSIQFNLVRDQLLTFPEKVV